MNHFVRFLFALVSSAALLALLIAVMFHYNSARERDARMQAEREDLNAMFKRASNGQIFAQMVVEWQKVGGDKNPLATAVLIRCMHAGSDKVEKSPLRRVVVRGDTVYLDAFDIRFQDNLLPEITSLQGNLLHVIGHVYGAEDVAAGGKNWKPGENDLLTVFYEVPDTYRHNARQVSALERRLWGQIWDHYQQWERGMPTKRVQFDQQPAMAQKLRPGVVYDIWVGTQIVIREREELREVEAMLQQAATTAPAE